MRSKADETLVTVETLIYDCDYLYLLLCLNKITIDERLNGFIACIVLFYDLLSIQCADLRHIETGA